MSWLTQKEDVRLMRAALGATWPCCPNCTYFSDSIYQGGDGLERCLLDPLKRRPPAKIIAEGCHQFEDDVPF